MKKIILLSVFLLLAFGMEAQKYQKIDTSYYSWGRSAGNTIIIDRFTNEAFDTVYLTPFIYQENGYTYPIFITLKGICFVYKIDPKTNKPYKLVFPESSSKYIKYRMAVGDNKPDELEGTIIYPKKTRTLKP